MTDLAVAPDGVLWGATSRGLFYRRHDRFVAVGVDDLPVDGMHLLAFGEGRTWITTTRGPFAATEAGRVEPAPGWPGGASFGILVEPGGAMLVGHETRLVRRAGPGAPFEDLGHDFVEPITHIVRDGAGRLWLRAGEHLWMQPRAGAPFEDRSRHYLGAPVGADGSRLAVSATGALLIPTSVGLIEVLDDQAHFVKTDLPDDARSIKSVWIDREGSLWLTSLGLHRELGRGLWRTLALTDGLPANNVWSITGTRDGRVAIGTDGGVLLLGSGAPEVVDVQSVVGVVEQPAGILWIATARKLVRYDLATKQRTDHGAEAGLPESRLSILRADPVGNLWIGHSSGGLYRAPAAAQPRFEHVTIPGADDSTIAGIAFDGDQLWVTTSHGLYVRDGATWHRFTKAHGLSDDNVLFLALRRSGEVCATYLAPVGLTCLRYASGAIFDLRHYDRRNGLNSPVPYFVTEDAAGRLWVGGAQGVSIFDGDTVDHFTRSGGAPGDDCNANAVWAAPGGDVWIGTSSGVGLFEGARYRRALSPPTVRLARGHLGDAVFDFETAVPSSVPFDRARLDVELAAMSFIDERRLQYQVRLLGFDDDWHVAEGRDARYHKLPPGTYQFAARARYRDGAWGEPTTFEFVVETPFWQTWWFLCLCAGAGLLVVGLTVRWRLRALVRRNLELEETVRERTRDLVDANEKVAHAEKLSALGRLLAQLSHEIHNRST